MPRNITPKNAMMEKSEIQDADKRVVYRHGKGAPGGTLGGKHVLLVGMRASGKTTLGEALSKKLGRPLTDTDRLVMDKAGKTIEQIVDESGWDEFRRLETEALREALAAEVPTIIATGGGIILAEENREMIRNGGPVFFLMATTLLVVDRLTRDMDPASRPPLTELPLTEEMSAVREERDPLYMEVANFFLRAEEPLAVLVEDAAEKLMLVGR